MRISLIFCLLFLFSFSAGAQDYSTRGEIYDYEVGDEFHFKKEYDGGSMEEYSNVFIIEKYVSPSQDTIQYTKFIMKSTWYGNDTIWYYSQDTTIETYTNPEAIFLADSVYFSPYYNRKISWQDHSIPPYWIESKYYADGCGLIKHNQREVQLPAYDIRYWMMYYKKSDQEWGDPYTIVKTSESEQDISSLNIYPNPVRDIMHIASSESIIEIQIHDQFGRLAIASATNISTVDISSLDRGVYFLTVITKEGKSCEKFVKQ